MFHRHFSPCFLVKAPDWPAHLCTIARSSPSGWRWVRMARGSRDRDHLHVPQLPYKPLSLHSIFYPWWFLNVFDYFKLYMCMYVVCMYVYVYVYVYIYTGILFHGFTFAYICSICMNMKFQMCQIPLDYCMWRWGWNHQASTWWIFPSAALAEMKLQLLRIMHEETVSRKQRYKPWKKILIYRKHSLQRRSMS
jgi:hypothetical protein